VSSKSVPPPRSAAGVNAASHLRVVLDFDGTLVEPNVAIILVEEFAPNGREVAHEIDLLLHEGKIGLREAWQRQVALLSADRMAEMVEFARTQVPLRKGAREMLNLFRRHDVPVTVVSGGLEFYIREVLDREGIDLPIMSDRLTVLPSGQLGVLHPFEHPTCRLCGICKAGIVQDGAPGRRSVFIADGSTDRYGAECADIVFARRRLLDYCRKVGIPAYPFEDFEPVTMQFARWLDAEEPLPLGRAAGLLDSPCPIARELAGGSPA
jgi:2-hydroxy-3-keto-5-methylthiopentenyl-1-phosphate phosphatase